MSFLDQDGPDDGSQHSGGSEPSSSLFSELLDYAGVASAPNQSRRIAPHHQFSVYASFPVTLKKEWLNTNAKLHVVEQWITCIVPGVETIGNNIGSLSVMPGETVPFYLTSGLQEETKNAASLLEKTSTFGLENLGETLTTEYQHADSTHRLYPSVTEVIEVLNGKTSAGESEHSVNRSACRAAQMKLLARAMSAQTATSNQHRIAQLIASGKKPSGKHAKIEERRVQNTNAGSVLHVQFNETVREYHAVTYLAGLQIVWSDAKRDAPRVIEIEALPSLLTEVIPSAHIAAVYEAVLSPYRQVLNFQDEAFEMVEEVSNGDQNAWPRIAKGLNNTLKRGDQHTTIPGVILGVNQYHLRTGSVRTEVQLGAGLAVDEYQLKLMDEACVTAQLENEKLRQALDIISRISDPDDQAAYYQIMFGDASEDDFYDDDTHEGEVE